MLEAEIRKLRPVSADSHVTEPPDCYAPRLDKKFRDRAPYLVNDPVKGAQFILEGMKPIRIGSLAAAGVPPRRSTPSRPARSTGCIAAAGIRRRASRIWSATALPER